MTQMRLNFGCGLNAPHNWTNLDSSFRVWVDRFPFFKIFGYKPRFAPYVKRLNIRGPLPFPDHSAAFIYSSHMIEHLHHDVAQAFVRECARILAPGGRIRLMTPNIHFAVEDYLARRQKPEFQQGAADFLMHCLGVFDENENIGALQRWILKFQNKNTHKWLYDEYNLKAMLEQSGFTNVIARDSWVSDFPDIDKLEPAELRDGSVCVEGFKI